MKITRKQLRQIISEELTRLSEITPDIYNDPQRASAQATSHAQDASGLGKYLTQAFMDSANLVFGVDLARANDALIADDMKGFMESTWPVLLIALGPVGVVAAKANKARKVVNAAARVNPKAAGLAAVSTEVAKKNLSKYDELVLGLTPVQRGQLDKLHKDVMYNWVVTGGGQYGTFKMHVLKELEMATLQAKTFAPKVVQAYREYAKTVM